MARDERHDERQDERRSGWHQVNIGHLVMGVAFLGILGSWGLVQGDVVHGHDIRWLTPLPWVLAGVVGLVATAVTGSRRYAVRQTGWVGTPSVAADDAEPLTEPPTEPLTEPVTAQPHDESHPEETP